MLIRSPSMRRLSALSAACLLSVALPSLPALAKEKTKTKPASVESAMSEFDYAISIPTIEASDSNVDVEVLGEILSGNLVEHADALAGLTATSITVPQIEVTLTGKQDGTDYSATFTLSDLVLDGVSDGVADGFSIAGVDMVTDEGQFEFGTISAANLDIGGVLGIYGLVGASEQTELETIYTDFVAEGGTLTADNIECTMGPVSGAEFKARPLRTSLLELIAMAEELENDVEDVDPALLGTFMRMYADLFTAFESSEVTFGGISCAGTDDEDRPIDFSIAGIAVGAMSPGFYPSVSMDDFELNIEGDGSMSLENLTFKPIDLSNVIATLESAPEVVDDAWLEANVRGLFPSMEGVSLTGFAIDVADPDVDGARIVADVGSFDLTLLDYLNGIPTVFDMSAANIRAEVPADTGDESLDQLRAFGITEIDLGFRVAASWNEEASTIDFEEVSVTGVDLATVTLAGTIANATANLFALDTNTALMAAMGLGVRSLDLSIVDAGLADIALAAIAAEQGGSPESLRPIYADLAKGTVISLMTGVADAAKLGDAVRSFIAGNATTLEVGLESKSAAGINMLDFAAAEENPQSLLDKVNVSAEAK